MTIRGISGQPPPDWGKKPDILMAQYQPKASDAKPAEQDQDIKKQKTEIPPYKVPQGEKPNLDNGGKDLEYWSDLRNVNLEQKQYKQDNLSEKLRNADLRDKEEVLKTCLFDSNTPWPPPEKLPPNFNPKKILERGMDPGLGIRDLQNYGIIINGVEVKLNGAGINAAIIDQPLPMISTDIFGKQARLLKKKKKMKMEKCIPIPFML